MTKNGLVIAALIVTSLGVATLAVNRFAVQAEVSQEHAHGITIYTCSMHSQILQDKPGTCPICSMELTPKKIDGKSSHGVATSTGATKKAHKPKRWIAPMDPSIISDQPGLSDMSMDLVSASEVEPIRSIITIDPVVVQNMGLRVARVEQGPIFRHVRTIGTVDVAEDEVSVVNLRYSGWVDRIYVAETGAQVQAGSVLFDIYSPELVSAQEEYLLALRSSSEGSTLLNSARRRLKFFDLTNWHIEQVEKAGKPLPTLPVVAPRTGHVLHKSVVHGARISAGTDLYRIGNLGKIWVNADVYEFDASWIAVGQNVTMKLSFQSGETYGGKVSYIYPTLNPKTRTLTVRLEFDNPDLSLKPGMFATVQIAAQPKGSTLKIPSEAIIHSGTREVVFVAIELGKYEMREITTGLSGDRHMTEVKSGLTEGERVVTSGQFLLDSESQLQEAVQKLLSARLHATETRFGLKEWAPDDQGQEEYTYWTCGMHPQVVQEGPGPCPICGMDLIAKKN